jgi:hypothetical protein
LQLAGGSGQQPASKRIGIKVRSADFHSLSQAFTSRAISYHLDFGSKNDDIGAENGYFWNNNIEISI